ncbi:hypothetical protein VM_06050 [Vibrio mimicus]|nr:hypothetical protein VM_06050 [Vibrio mimicus]
MFALARSYGSLEPSQKEINQEYEKTFTNMNNKLNNLGNRIDHVDNQLNEKIETVAASVTAGGHDAASKAFVASTAIDNQLNEKIETVAASVTAGGHDAASKAFVASTAIDNQLNEKIETVAATITKNNNTDGMRELYAQGKRNEAEIGKLWKEVDRLDKRMDGVMANTQAVNASRPYLLNGQTSSIGVGLGHAGSANSISVGYAHRISENWAASGNVGYTDAEDTKFSFGVGASYAW